MVWHSGLLDQRTVVLALGAAVDVRPALLAVVLEAVELRAEERRVAVVAALAFAFVTGLIVEHVRLQLDLEGMNVATLKPIHSC